jgi:DNA-binding NtrC family response regulator
MPGPGRQPDIKGIIMTGYGESLDESLRKGVHEVIQKPFNLYRIKILLEEALGSGE